MSNEFIEDFNEFLAGEISAVETYDLALKCVKKKTSGKRSSIVETRIPRELTNWLRAS